MVIKGAPKGGKACATCGNPCGKTRTCASKPPKERAQNKKACAQ